MTMIILDKDRQKTNICHDGMAPLISVPDVLSSQRFISIRHFHKHTKLAIIYINANIVVSYICSFLHYLDHKILVNIIVDVSWRLHWSFKFWMAQAKRSCQYWHSSIEERSWKTLMFYLLPGYFCQLLHGTWSCYLMAIAHVVEVFCWSQSKFFLTVSTLFVF